MTATSDRYRRLSTSFAHRIAAVPEDAWDNQSPCSEWTTRGVVKHVVDAQGMFVGFIGAELGTVPNVDNDPAGAWDAVSGTVQDLLENPATATQEFDGFFGRTSFESAVDRFLCLDLIIHGWDVARAAGLDEHIDSDDVRAARATFESFGDALRAPGVCGPELPAPPGADEQTKLLRFLGRAA